MPDKPNIIITTLKEACESEDIILRMYEAHGIRTRTQISCGFSMDRAYEADMMENETEQLSVDNSGFKAQFGPYEVKTFVLKRVN